MVDRNARSRLGELDLVALHGATVVFVEVRTRRSASRGTPEESVNPRKLARLTRLAQGYLKQHPSLRNRPARIDVVAVRIRPRGVEIVHLPNVTG